MNVKSNNHKEQAFTLPEVALAIGVIGLGLVAVFSVLPFGLTAQKDNEEETIMRYEAQYWREALLSDGLLLEELKRVDRIEIHSITNKTTHTFVNPHRLRPDPKALDHSIIRYEENATDRFWYTYPTNSLSLAKARKYWPSDIQGWLLNPISQTGPEGSFALVRALNGSLFDRFNGAEPERDDYYFPNRDFSTGYILQVQATTNTLTKSGSRIKMTFYWPLFEQVTEALEPKPTAVDPMAKYRLKRISDIVKESQSGGDIPPFKSMEFTITTSGLLEPALLESNLTLQERRFMREMRVLQPNERVDPDDPRLEGLFNDYYSFKHNYGGQPRNRRMFNNGDRYFYKVKIPGDSWVGVDKYSDRSRDPSFRPDKWFFELPYALKIQGGTGVESIVSPIGHSGMWLHTYGGNSPVQIAWVNPSQFPYFGKYDKNGIFSGLLPPNFLPYFKFGTLDSDAPNHYRISFLGLDPGGSGKFQTWESILRDYAVAKRGGRPNLLINQGEHYTLRQHMRITTHRRATADEMELNKGFPKWDKVYDEKKVPRLWRVVQ